MSSPPSGVLPGNGPRRLVLVGAGHAHAQVLRSLALYPVDNLEITVISPFTQAPYSGMMPAWLAGDYSWDACCIDFDRLCQRAGARMIVDSVTSIDPDARIVMLQGSGQLGYERLSINIGSTVDAPISSSMHAALMRIVPMRPLSALRERWQGVLDDIGKLPVGANYRVVMVGGGAAGIESILSVHHRLTTIAPGVAFRFTLVTQGDVLVPSLSGAAGKILRRHLHRRGIEIKTGCSVKEIKNGMVVDDAGQSVPADLVLWATGAQSFTWPRKSGISCNAAGFIRIDAMLRSSSHPDIFAAGDCADWKASLPKAGVYAVRMGPVLAHNLRASFADAALKMYQPQRRYLVLVGTGDRHAVASWGPFGWSGAWVYRFKQRIDRRFLARYGTMSM
ncbi:MAG: FAD-dependent oxidoreductase [Pseudomonadota bacterium]